MNHIRLDLGVQDICLSDIAEKVVEDCAEDEMLLELSRENENLGARSKDETEKAFAFQAATKLRELARWFKETAP